VIVNVLIFFDGMNLLRNENRVDEENSIYLIKVDDLTFLLMFLDFLDMMPSLEDSKFLQLFNSLRN
jgi:hypothetical protein